MMGPPTTNTEQQGEDDKVLLNHVNDLNNIAKQYSHSDSAECAAKTIQSQLKKLYNDDWNYEVKDGRIIWLANKMISAISVEDILEAEGNKMRCIHINTGTHGDKDGNIITLDENEKYYTDCTAFMREDMANTLKREKVSINFVTAYSGPIYPEYDVIDAWCYSENKFEKHYQHAGHIAAILSGKIAVPDCNVKKQVGDMSVDVLNPRVLKKYLDCEDKVLIVGRGFGFTKPMLWKLERSHAGGGHPVKVFLNQLQANGTCIRTLQNIFEKERGLWKAKKIMAEIVADKNPETMADINETDLSRFINCLTADARNPLQKNWKDIAGALGWFNSDIEEICGTIRNENRYSPTGCLISMLSSKNKTMNDFLEILKEINKDDGTFQRTISYINESIETLEQKTALEDAANTKKSEMAGQANKLPEKVNKEKKDGGADKQQKALEDAATTKKSDMDGQTNKLPEKINKEIPVPAAIATKVDNNGYAKEIKEKTKEHEKNLEESKQQNPVPTAITTKVDNTGYAKEINEKTKEHEKGVEANNQQGKVESSESKKPDECNKPTMNVEYIIIGILIVIVAILVGYVLGKH